MGEVSESTSARLTAIEDRLAIQEIVGVYCVAVDDKDWALLSSLYAKDAVLGDAVGRDAVVEAIRSVRETYGRTVHSPHSTLVRFESGERASGLVTSHAELDISGELIVCHIRYYDDYVKENGAWRFARRELKFLYAIGWADLGQSLADAHPVRWPGAEPAPADDFDRWRMA